MLRASGGKQRGICNENGNQQPEHERDEDGNYKQHSGLLLLEPAYLPPIHSSSS